MTEEIEQPFTCNMCEDTGVAFDEILVPLEPCCKEWLPDGQCCGKDMVQRNEFPCPVCSNNEE